MDLLDYYRKQNQEQRQTIDEKEETIKLLQKSDYEAKQSFYEKLIEVRNIGKSNDMHKNIKILDIVEELINDLYFDIQEELNQALEKEYKKELDVGKTN